MRCFGRAAEGLVALVHKTMLADPFSGTIYVFRAKRADRMKLIYWDGTGVCLFAKRLEDGRFQWPSNGDGVLRRVRSVGLDWRRVHTARIVRVPTVRAGRVTPAGPAKTSSRRSRRRPG